MKMKTFTSESELMDNKGAFQTPKTLAISYRDALVGSVYCSENSIADVDVIDYDDMPPLEEAEPRIVIGNPNDFVAEALAAIAALASSQEVQAKKKRSRRRRRRRVITKPIVIEEIDDLEDDYPSFDDIDHEMDVLVEELESLKAAVANCSVAFGLKYVRKYRNRRMRRALQKLKDKADMDLIDQVIESQGGVKSYPSVIAQNISAMKAIGVTKESLDSMLRKVDFSKKVFTPKQLRRLKREDIQRRAASMLEKRIRSSFTKEDRVNAELLRARARDAKYEEQGMGAVITGVAVAGLIIDKARSVFKTIEKKHDDFLSFAREKLQELSNKLKHFGVIIKTGIVATIIYYLWKSFPNPIITTGLLTLIPIVLPEAKDCLCAVFSQHKQQEEIETQAGDNSGFIGHLVSAIVLFFTGIRGKPRIGSAIVEAVAKLPRMGKGVECLIDLTIKGLEQAMNVVLRFLNKPEIRFRKKLAKEVDDAVKKAWALDKKITSKDFEVRDSPGVYGECMSAMSNIVRLIAIHRDNYPVRQELVQVRGMLSSHCTSLQSTLGRGAGYRVEPVSVVIESTPGVGKTMQIPVLIGSLLKNSGIVPDITVETSHESFFTRPANSDYFDGYFGQECYYIDDLFAIKPIPGKVSHIEDIMSFYGNVTTMLNMAECEKKGMYPFTSSLLLMTTNVTDLDQVAVDAIMVDRSALMRRFDVHVHVQVKPEYGLSDKPSMLDYRKYELECEKLKADGKFGFEAHPWYIWEAWPTQFGGPASFPPGTGVCFSQVVLGIVDKLRYKRESHKRAMEHLRLVLSDGPLNEEQSGDLVVDSSELEVDPIDRWVPTIEVCPSDFKSHHAYREALRRNSPPLSAIDEDDCPCVGDVEESMTRREAWWAMININLIDYENVKKNPNLLDKFINQVWRFLEPVRRFLRCPALPFQVGVATAIGYMLFAAIKKVTESLVGAFRHGPSDEVQSNGPLVVPTAYRRPETMVTLQAGGVVTVQDRIFNQSYKLLVAVGDDGVLPLGQMLFIAGNVAVMPKHYIEQIQKMVNEGTATPKTMIMMKPCNGAKGSINTTIGAFFSYRRLEHDEDDLCFVNFSKGVRLFPDITHHILYEREVPSIGGRQVRLDVGNVIHDGSLAEVCTRISYMSEAEVGRTVLNTSTRSYPHWIGYESSTSKGDCGAPLFVTDHRHYACRTLVGLHVAGSPRYGKGFSTILTQERCVDALKYFGHKEVPEATHEESCWPADIEVQNDSVVVFTDDGTLGTATPLYSVNQGVSSPIRSSLVKTGFGEEKFFDDEIAIMNEGREPPHLVPMKMGPYVENGELIFPMEQAVRPFVGDVFLPASNSFDIPLAAGLKAFSDATVNFEARVLNFDEAVLGSPVLGLKSLTRGTSVGYPLCLVARNKKHFFGDGDEFDLERPECKQLRKQVASLEQVIRSGKRPQFVCRDFLKDETRKEGKGARLIAGTDLRYYILCRMYFGAFVGAIRRSHNQSGICLGLNPYSEWGMLKRLLLRPDPTGKNVWDGDFAGFDSSQMPRLLWACLDFINNWYADRGESSSNEIRRILFMDLVGSRHIVSYRGVATSVVEWAKSLPSGHFLTSTINSMLSMGLVASGFIATTGNVNFWENCAAGVLGDDNVVSTRDEFVGLFNQVTLSQHLMQEYGMVYTAGRKGEELRPTIGIDDVVFLQRRFAVKNGQDVCPIRPESFLHSLYFVKSNDFTRNRETLKAGIELAFEELSMHDEKYWGIVAPKLVRAKQMLGESPNFSTANSDVYFELVRGRVPSYI